MQELLTPSAEDLAALIDSGEGPCVSIYLPTHRRGAETREDPIRFKNLLSQAEHELTSNGIAPGAARTLIEPARSLIDDHEFWQHLKEGLAVFIGDGVLRVCRMPYRVPEAVQVSDFFSLRRVLPMLDRLDVFYVLALSQKNIRLFHSTGDALQEVQLPEGPRGLADLLQYIDAEKSLQFHTAQSASDGGPQSQVFHGQGANETNHKMRIFELFRMLDDALRREIPDRSLPLVPAGDKPVVTIFRQATTYPNVTDDQIVGNIDHLGVDELMSRALTIAQPVLQKKRKAAVERFVQVQGAARASNELPRIIQAAHYGQVELLLVDEDARAWGPFDPDTGQAEVHEQSRPGDRDLVELAVLLALRSSAEVHQVPRGTFGQAPVAAVLRPGAAETQS